MIVSGFCTFNDDELFATTAFPTKTVVSNRASTKNINEFEESIQRTFLLQ